MSLFDKIKETAEDLVRETREKVAEVTGVDADNLLDAAKEFVDAGKDVSHGITTIKDGRAEA